MHDMKHLKHPKKVLHYSLLCAVSVLLIFVSGCSKNSELPPAPIGNIKTLEKLADSYNIVAEGFPMNIQVLPPQQKHEFVAQVFSKTGYDYRATLLAMASSSLDPQNKNQKDLAELLLLPTVGLVNEDIEDLFSDDEIKAINKIEASLR